jgi:hypothetical protein
MPMAARGLRSAAVRRLHSCSRTVALRGVPRFKRAAMLLMVRVVSFRKRVANASFWGSHFGPGRSAGSVQPKSLSPHNQHVQVTP